MSKVIDVDVLAIGGILIITGYMIYRFAAKPSPVTTAQKVIQGSISGAVTNDGPNSIRCIKAPCPITVWFNEPCPAGYKESLGNSRSTKLCSPP